MSEHGLSLFEIDSTIAQLVEVREEMTEAGEDTADVDAEIARYLGEQLPAKVDGIRGFVRQEETIASAAKEEAARLSQIAAARLARVARLKEYLLFALQAAGKTKLEGRTGGSISVCANGGGKRLVISDPALVPDEYCGFDGYISSNAWEWLGSKLGPEAWGYWVGREDVRISRQPNTAYIRAVLEKECEVHGCDHGMQPHGVDADGQPTVITCPACGGSGKQGVPGAHLEPRGKHVRIK